MKRILFALVALLIGASAFAQNTTNLPVTLFASAARTTSATTADQSNTAWHRIQLLVNVTVAASGTYTPHIQGKDPVSGGYYDILVGNAISTTGMTVLTVGPGVLALPNAASQQFLPRTWRVQMVGASTPSMTFSVGAVLGN